MAEDESDDLYEEEYDFVDDEEDSADEASGESQNAVAEDVDQDQGEQQEEELDEYGRPSPTANYVVHVYEHKKFKRTIDRPFTPEEAEAFATEYNRTAKTHGRVALAGKNDAKPKKAID